MEYTEQKYKIYCKTKIANTIYSTNYREYIVAEY